MSEPLEGEPTSSTLRLCPARDGAPWTEYRAHVGTEHVGMCAFKTQPVDGRVEIAYHTFPRFEGRGFATQMARELVAIARRERPVILVFAQTLREENASTALLKKLGFELQGTVEHPEDGKVWEWHLGARGRPSSRP